MKIKATFVPSSSTSTSAALSGVMRRPESTEPAEISDDSDVSMFSCETTKHVQHVVKGSLHRRRRKKNALPRQRWTSRCRRRWAAPRRRPPSRRRRCSCSPRPRGSWNCATATWATSASWRRTSASPAAARRPPPPAPSVARYIINDWMNEWRSRKGTVVTALLLSTSKH